MVRIPEEYQEVEYIESTGTQYITTDYFVSTENIRILVDADTTPAYSEKSFIGNQDNATGRFVLGTYRYYFYGYARSKQSEANVVSTTFSDSIESRYVIDMTYDLDNGEKSMVINGTKYTATHSVSIISTIPVQIFADGKALYKSNWKCRSVVLYDSENLALKLIPCYRKSDNKPGMYDTVSGTFYTNSGTGTFLVGNPVEYSTVSLLEARRRILLNTPHLESISGTTASFETDMASKLKECKVYFSPVQEGSGDPSPDNIRPIRGYDSITIYNGQTAVATIPFPQTIYGGYVDLVKGEAVETYVSRKINTANFGTRLRTNVTDYRGANDYYKSMGLSEFPAPLSNDTYLCDKLYNTGRVTTTGGLTAYMYCNFGSSKYMYVYALASELSEDTLDGLRAYISDLDPQFVYKVNETDYTTYPLDPVTIRTLRGINNIWSDSNGNIEVKFWTH